jgi:long-subunit fatty acid transport protein
MAGGQVQWRATGSFLLYAGYTYIKVWRNPATETVDAYTPKANDVNGNPVAKPGAGEFDRTSAFVGASYQLNEHYSIDLGVSTIQTPLTPTGQVRFPFLSFGTWADNATSVYFSLYAAY